MNISRGLGGRVADVFEGYIKYIKEYGGVDEETV